MGFEFIELVDALDEYREARENRTEKLDGPQETIFWKSVARLKQAFKDAIKSIF